MPEGNEIHRFAERHARAFAGRRVRVDSPNGGFPDAEVLNGRTLRSVEAVGKHLGYIFGRDLILHIHLGMYGDFWEGRMPLPPEKGALRLRIYTKSDWIELRGGTDTSIFSEEKWQALLARLGPDPLREGSDPKGAFAVIGKRNYADRAVIDGSVGDRRDWKYLSRRAALSGEDQPVPAGQGDERGVAARHLEGCADADAGGDGRSQDCDHEGEGQAAPAGSGAG